MKKLIKESEVRICTTKGFSHRFLSRGEEWRQIEGGEDHTENEDTTEEMDEEASKGSKHTQEDPESED